MDKSMVIPHDLARSPRLRHLTGAGDFQEAVDSWPKLIEMSAVEVAIHVNEAGTAQQSADQPSRDGDLLALHGRTYAMPDRARRHRAAWQWQQLRAT